MAVASDRQRRRCCPGLQINSARLKAIVREREGKLQEDKCRSDSYQQRRRGNWKASDQKEWT